MTNESTTLPETSKLFVTNEGGEGLFQNVFFKILRGVNTRLPPPWTSMYSTLLLCQTRDITCIENILEIPLSVCKDISIKKITIHLS